METIIDDTCNSRTIFEDLSKKWVIIIVMLLQDRSLRFGELQRSAKGISQKVLTQNLRMLEHSGLVDRVVNPGTIPITVTYSLTTLGQSVIPAFAMFRSWVEAHADEITTTRKNIGSA